MNRTITTILLCLTLAQTYGQTNRKLTTYLLSQYNNTLSDISLGNNPWGIGLGLQAYLNNKTKFKPTMEATADVYLMDDKVLRMDANGIPLNDVRSMVNLFLGTSFHPTHSIFVSIVAGPSFLGGQTLFGIKPSVGLCFPSSQRWAFKISYIDIINRGNTIKQDFRSFSIGLGLKLY